MQEAIGSSPISPTKRNTTVARATVVFYVCRAWHVTRWCKSTMGVDSDQPLAEGKGVHREVESEGSLRQSSGLRNTNHMRRFRMDKAA